MRYLSCPSPSIKKPALVPRADSGFTLIELITVVVIIGILAAIIIPTVSAVRASAATSKSASNLRTLGTAHLMYRTDHRGSAPPYSYIASHPYSEGHSGWGILLLRRYYMPGPNYVWSGGRMLLDTTIRCPLADLTGIVRSNRSMAAGDYAMAPGLNTINVNARATAPSRIPAVWMAWSPQWVNSSAQTMPLRVKNQAILAAFLDGHVDQVRADEQDGRLYYNWWREAALNLNPSDANLRRGHALGTTHTD